MPETPPALPHAPSALLRAFLTATEQSILPLTRAGVASGSKVFGAAVLRGSDLGLVLAGTNEEAQCPLWHGEMVTIREFYAQGHTGAQARECVFFSTHEPCSLCLSALAWSGFRHIFFLFSHATTASAFAIPHDLDILSVLFRVRTPQDTDESLAARPLYNRENAFLRVVGVDDLMRNADVDAAERVELEQKWSLVKQEYGILAEEYAKRKGEQGIPLP